MAHLSTEGQGSALDIASAEVGAGLSHSIRIAILRLLAGRGELCSCEIEPCFAVDPSRVSRHLSALREAGLVISRRDGVRILHRLASPHVVELLSLVDRVAADEADARCVLSQEQQTQYRSEVNRRASPQER